LQFLGYLLLLLLHQWRTEIDHSIQTVELIVAEGEETRVHVFTFGYINVAFGTHKDETTVLYKTISLDGTKP